MVPVRVQKLPTLIIQTPADLHATSLDCLHQPDPDFRGE